VSAPLDELYLNWLYEQVADPNIDDEYLTYWGVLRVLYTKEFVSVVPHDDNRIMDGKALRREFINSQGVLVDSFWIELGCSVLEVMVGLSRRLEFVADGEPHYWFWELMTNLGLHQYNDTVMMPEEDIDEMLDRLIFRHYEPSGVGGFFPLSHVNEDQRCVELWKQLSNYVEDIAIT
jgi:hypothetical protein